MANTLSFVLVDVGDYSRQIDVACLLDLYILFIDGRITRFSYLTYHTLCGIMAATVKSSNGD